MSDQHSKILALLHDSIHFLCQYGLDYGSSATITGEFKVAVDSGQPTEVTFNEHLILDSELSRVREETGDSRVLSIVATLSGKTDVHTTFSVATGSDDPYETEHTQTVVSDSSVPQLASSGCDAAQSDDAIDLDTQVSLSNNSLTLAVDTVSSDQSLLENVTPGIESEVQDQSVPPVSREEGDNSHTVEDDDMNLPQEEEHDNTEFIQDDGDEVKKMEERPSEIDNSKVTEQPSSKTTKDGDSTSILDKEVKEESLECPKCGEFLPGADAYLDHLNVHSSRRSKANVKSSDDTPNTRNLPPRKRGRPPKYTRDETSLPSKRSKVVSETSETEDTPTAIEADTPVRRGRGRPSRSERAKSATGESNPLRSDISDTPAADDVNTPVRRGRGRPRHSDTAKSSVSKNTSRHDDAQGTPRPEDTDTPVPRGRGRTRLSDTAKVGSDKSSAHKQQTPKSKTPKPSGTPQLVRSARGRVIKKPNRDDYVTDDIKPAEGRDASVGKSPLKASNKSATKSSVEMPAKRTTKSSLKTPVTKSSEKTPVKPSAKASAASSVKSSALMPTTSNVKDSDTSPTSPLTSEVVIHDSPSKSMKLSMDSNKTSKVKSAKSPRKSLEVPDHEGSVSPESKTSSSPFDQFYENADGEDYNAELIDEDVTNKSAQIKKLSEPTENDGEAITNEADTVERDVEHMVIAGVKYSVQLVKPAVDLGAQPQKSEEENEEESETSMDATDAVNEVPEKKIRGRSAKRAPWKKLDPAYHDLECKYCKRRMSSATVLRDHMRLHEGGLKCTKCSSEFTTETRYRDHIRHVHEGVRLKCPECGKLFPNRDAFSYHLRVHRGFVYRCPVEECKFFCVKKCEMILHLTQGMHRPKKPDITATDAQEDQDATAAKHTCHLNECGKPFNNTKDFKEHLFSHLDNSTWGRYCGGCDTVFPDAAQVSEHTRVCFRADITGLSRNIRRFIGEVEPYDDINLQDLKDGEVGDSDLEDDIPDEPESEESQSFLLEDPEGVQSKEETDSTQNKEITDDKDQQGGDTTETQLGGEKAFKCSTCGLMYGTLEILESHVKDEHGNPKFPCPKCSKVFLLKYRLNQHLRVQHQGQRYPCSQCDKVYRSKDYLVRHVRFAHRERRIRVLPRAEYERTCTLCKALFKSKHLYYEHMRSKHYEARFQCPMCPKMFFRRYQVADHIEIDHNNNGFDCPVCGKSVPRKHAAKHQRLHDTGPRAKCPHCDKSYKRIEQLHEHQWKFHGERLGRFAGKEPGEDSRFECNICGKLLSCRMTLNDHLKWHTGNRIQCPQCPRSFIRNSRLEAHLREAHQGLKYPCTVCGKLFNSLDYLGKHVKLHSAPCKCTFEGCERAFANRVSLEIHMRTHTKEKPYICDQCGRAFASPLGLRYHIQIHRGVKDFICSFPGCSLAFYNKYMLQRHEVKHTGTKKFFCTRCGSGFWANSYLKKHESLCGADVKFKCDQCDKAYKYPNGLNRHKRRHHPADLIQQAAAAGEILSHGFVDDVEKMNVSLKEETDAAAGTMVLLADVKGEDVIAEAIDGDSIVVENIKPEDMEALTGNTIVVESAQTELETSNNAIQLCYQCSICSAAFLDQQAYNEHMVSHFSSALGSDVKVVFVQK